MGAGRSFGAMVVGAATQTQDDRCRREVIGEIVTAAGLGNMHRGCETYEACMDSTVVRCDEVGTYCMKFAIVDTQRSLLPLAIGTMNKYMCLPGSRRKLTRLGIFQATCCSSQAKVKCPPSWEMRMRRSSSSHRSPSWHFEDGLSTHASMT